MPQTISEFGLIKKASDYELADDTFSEVFVSDRTFQYLKNIALSGVNDLILNYLTQKGKEQIRVKNYVGLLQTPDGKQIEILPKSTANSPKEARKILLKMLRVLPNSPYQSLSNSHLETSHLPLFEIFVNVFLDELEKLLSQGLGRNFERHTANETFVKGKILIAENLRQNPIQKERFFIAFDEFTADIPPNKVLKYCLQILYKQGFSHRTTQRINQNSRVFEEVNQSKNIEQDLVQSFQKNLTFVRYEKLLHWANVFIKGQSFLPFSGQYLQLGLLFPMEVLFENYVGKFFKKYFAENYEVKLQDKAKFLIDSHLDKSKFRLIPDIVLKNETQSFVFDTKWKLIDATKHKQNYGIDQSDLYQMYAYGKKYNAQQVFLIYPANENFQLPLQVFDYEADMRLQIIPFDLTKNLQGLGDPVFFKTLQVYCRFNENKLIIG
ncbi:MAG: McrC family protein [Emticicia sp.]|nr:McrC family protein [Emticicia sp.]